MLSSKLDVFILLLRNVFHRYPFVIENFETIAAKVLTEELEQWSRIILL